MRKAMVILFAGIFALLIMGGELLQQQSQAMPIPSPIVEPSYASYPSGLYLRMDAAIGENLPHMTIEIKRVDDTLESRDVHMYEISILDKKHPDTLIQRFQCHSTALLEEGFLQLEDTNGDGYRDLVIQSDTVYVWDTETSSFTAAA